VPAEQEGSLSEERNAVEFLRRRWASAIDSGDDRTATRLRAQLDRIMNGRLARANLRLVSAQDSPAERRRSDPGLLAGLWSRTESGSAGAQGGIPATVERNRAS
jgi:hypothetical protein